MGRQRRSGFSFRKLAEQKEMAELNDRFLFAAGYCRLSVEQEDGGSIAHQKEVIENWLQGHPEIRLTRFFVDDGVTGTLMERPAWTRMMQEAREGKIQCILVKDLSRFGRNYVETGYYLEHVFPKLGIRFIACTEDLDTGEAADPIPVKIRNLVNDLYARDISRKVTAVFERQREAGTLRRRPVYGYLREGKTGELGVDRAAQPFVKMMFVWAEMGVGITEIADRLRLVGANPPGADGERASTDGESAPWTPATVRRILQDPTYTGTYISGRVRTRMHQRQIMDEEDWTRIEGHHEAIVSPELFAAVQKRMKNRGHGRGNGLYRTEMKGKLFCGVCGGPLRLTVAGGNRRYARYSCFNHTGINRKRKEYERLGRAPSIREEELTERIIAEGGKRAEDWERLRWMVNGAEEDGGILEGPKAAVIAAKGERDRALREREEVLAARAEGRTDTQSGMLQLETARKRCEAAERELAEKMSFFNQAQTDVQRAKETLREEEDALDMAERIELMPDGELRIRFRLDAFLERLGRWQEGDGSEGTKGAETGILPAGLEER